MTKFAKISLVAALAVTAASAVDFSGSAAYRFNNTSANTSATGSKDANEYKTTLTAKQQVSDDFKVTVGASMRSDDTTATSTEDKITIPTVSFTYTGVKDLTVIAGRQALNTPWTEGSSVIDGTQQGNGVLGLYNAGFATVAAGHFTNNNITVDAATSAIVKDSDLNVVAAIVPLPMIGATAQAWFVDVGAGGYITSDTHAASYNLAGKVANVSYDARYSTLTLNDAAAFTLSKVVASTNVAGVDLTLGYGKTGDSGSFVSFDKDGDASFGLEIANLYNLKDTKVVLVGAGYNVLPSVNASVSYLDINGKTADHLKDSSEVDVALTYTASKNMTAKVVYAQLSAETKANDSDLTRVELVYKF